MLISDDSTLELRIISDFKEIEEIYQDPYISNAIKQDNRDLTPLCHPLIKYYGTYIDNKLKGLFLCIAYSDCEVEIHSLLKKESIKYSRKFGEMMRDLTFSNKHTQRITLLIVDGLNTVKNYSKKIGFKLEGIKRNAYPQNNIYKDVYMYGLTRTEWSKL